jgi:4-hydroxythreonine-4-phosphate dehydrogenase
MSAIIAITPGEPAGIGPDLAVISAQSTVGATAVYFADPELLKARARELKLDIQIEIISSLAKLAQSTPAPESGKMFVYPVKMAVEAAPGKLDKRNAAYVLDCIRQATESVQQHLCHALMTGPIHKGVINDAGIRFSGHTEYLAELTSATPVMMLTAEEEKLRVALVTTHLPLSQVSAAITPQTLEQVLRILHRDLQQKYAIAEPHILVCGLNPHAGEGGHMGREEIEIIEPVLHRLRAEGMDLTGPLPADTLFTPKYLQQADAVLAMYHDQGLPVLKYVGFGHAVNITLGLPIIRTSVDHGTALDLAASGHIDNGSYMAALHSAIFLANQQLKHQV